VLLIAFLYLWLKAWESIDKYWIVPARKLFYFHHCCKVEFIQRGCAIRSDVGQFKSERLGKHLD